jgi:hypothetical protein
MASVYASICLCITDKQLENTVMHDAIYKSGTSLGGLISLSRILAVSTESEAWAMLINHPTVYCVSMQRWLLWHTSSLVYYSKLP